MDLEAAEVKLYLRKYQWALADLTQEVQEGCPFLRTVSDSSVQRFLIYTRSFSTNERLELATLILKSWHRPAMQLIGELFTQEAETKIYSCRLEMRTMVLPTVSSTPVTKTFAVKRAESARSTLSFLSAAFGSKPRKLFSLNWSYTAPIGDWQFCTELDFGGTWGTEIRCVHRLVRNDSRNWGLMPMSLHSPIGPIQVPQAFSLLSLYGLPLGTYHINNANDVQVASQAILDTHNRLFQVVPNWIDELTID